MYITTFSLSVNSIFVAELHVSVVVLPCLVDASQICNPVLYNLTNVMLGPTQCFVIHIVFAEYAHICI